MGRQSNRKWQKRADRYRRAHALVRPGLMAKFGAHRKFKVEGIGKVEAATDVKA